MPELSERERLLVHDAVSTTVDTILAAIQQEIRRSEAGAESGVARVRHFVDGLRAAEGAAATASVAARAAAVNSNAQQSMRVDVAA